MITKNADKPVAAKIIARKFETDINELRTTSEVLTTRALAIIEELETARSALQQTIDALPVDHVDAMGKQSTDGSTNTDHDDRLRPPDCDGADPITPQKIFYREDITGLGSGATNIQAEDIPTNVSNFDGNLSAADSNLQLVCDTLDDLAMGGGSEETANKTYTIPLGSTAAQAQAIVDSIGKHIHSDVSIILQFEDGTYTWTGGITVSGFFGGGTLSVKGDETDSESLSLHTNQSVIINGTDASAQNLITIEGNSLKNLYVRYINASLSTTSSDGSNCIRIHYNAGNVDVQGCYVRHTASQYGRGIGVYYNSGTTYIAYNYVRKLYIGIYSYRSNYSCFAYNDDYSSRPVYGILVYGSHTSWYASYPAGTSYGIKYDQGGTCGS